MSPEMMRLARAGKADHDRAQALAAEAVDGPLEPRDDEWLEAHRGACPDCAAVAEEYRAIHLELRALAAPEPPRDLWARTSAALDVVDSKAAGRFGGVWTSRPGNRPLVATAVAVGLVVVVAAASLIGQSPLATPASAPAGSNAIAIVTPRSGQSFEAEQAPLAVVDGTSYWIASESGIYQIKGGTAECAAADGSCTMASGSGQTLGSIASDQEVSAAIAPDARQAAVWTNDKLVVLPLESKPKTVSMDSLTPQPTFAATPTPSLVPTAPAASGSASSPAIPSTSPEASASPSTLTPTPTPTPTPTSTPEPTAATQPASASPTPAPSVSAAAQPIAILSGYEIVGRDPEFSPDGSLLAFEARPVDQSTAPDVFVWRSGQAQATQITFSHSAMFAGWYGQRILISEILPATAAGGAGATTAPGSAAPASSSYIYDPSTGQTLEIDRSMLLPAVDPTGQYVVYWAGTVELDPVSGLWQPGSGDLFIDSWSDLTLSPASFAPAAVPTESPSASPSATPSPTPAATPSTSPTPVPSPIETPTAGPGATATGESSTPSPAAVSSPASGPSVAPQPAWPQLLPVTVAPGMVQCWIVAWDASGGHIAVWVADPGSTKVGRLSLYSIDPTSGLVQTNEPLLAADKVMANIAFDAGHLVYTSAVDGNTYMQAVPAVPPSTVATPATTAQATSGASGGDAAGPASPSPVATNRPGS